MRTFKRPIGEADELFAALRRRTDQHQNALLLVFEPGLQVDPIGPNIGVAFRRQIAFLLGVVLVVEGSWLNQCVAPSVQKWRGQAPIRYAALPIRPSPTFGEGHQFMPVAARTMTREESRTLLRQHHVPWLAALALALSYRFQISITWLCKGKKLSI